MQFRKDLFADERDDNLNEIGKPTQRQDMIGHVTGTSRFFDDRNPAGLTHLKVLRSPHDHARIRAIDVGRAQAAPGVLRVLQAADVPVNLNTLLSLLNFGKDDEPTLAEGKVRYRGEPVVAVVAETEAAAYAALDLVRVDYEPLPAVLDVEAALAPGAPVVNDVYPGNAFEYHERYNHQRLRFGDVEQGFRAADHVLEQRYQMSPIEHAPTETNGCIAEPEQDGRIVVYTSTQALFFSLDTSAKILAVPSNRLHFIGGTVGGGFGGKVDTITEPLAILGVMLTGRPVRFALNRSEEMQASSPRGAERIIIKDGIMNDGRIVARQLTHYFDAGAYTRLSSYAVIKCAAHMPGPYTIANVSADGYCVYTNRTPASAMRGFGITGADFALEIQMDKLARLVGIDPMEFRILNAYRDGDMKAHRRIAKNCALIECVQAAAELADWPLAPAFKAMSSRTGGGGERAAMPVTVTGPGSAPVQAAPTVAPTAASSTGPGAAPSSPTPASIPAPPARGPGPGRLSSLMGIRRR